MYGPPLLLLIHELTQYIGDNSDAAIWSNIEANVGIICACLPTIKPIISRVFPHLLGSTRSRGGTHPSHHASLFQPANPFGIPSPYRPNDSVGGHKTITHVEAGDRSEPELGIQIGEDENGKDIFVMTSMTQDVERKPTASEAGSEKDLIFQLN